MHRDENGLRTLARRQSRIAMQLAVLLFYRMAQKNPTKYNLINRVTFYN